MMMNTRVRSARWVVLWLSLLLVAYGVIGLPPGKSKGHSGSGITIQTPVYLGQVSHLGRLHTDVYLQRGFTYEKLGQYSSAIRVFNQAIALEPEFAAAYSLRGWSYFQQGLHAQAIADFDQAIALTPDDCLALYGRGLAHWQRGQWQWAIQDFDQVLLLNLTIRMGYVSGSNLAPTLAEVYFYRGSALVFQGQIEKGIADLSQAITLNPEHNQAYWVRALAYIDSGDWLKAEDDFISLFALVPEIANRAIDYFTGLIQKDATDLVAYYFRAIAYGFREEYSAAIADLTHVIALNSELALAYFLRGKMQFASGREDSAIPDLQKALALELPEPLAAEAQRLIAQKH